MAATSAPNISSSDPAVHEIENVFLFDIDDLESVVEANLEGRRQSAVEAEEIIEQEVEKFLQREASGHAGPLIHSLRRKFEAVCLVAGRWIARARIGAGSTQPELLAVAQAYRVRGADV